MQSWHVPHTCCAIYIAQEFHYFILKIREFAMSLGGHVFLNAFRNWLRKPLTKVARRVPHVNIPWLISVKQRVEFPLRNIRAQPTPYVELRGLLSTVWANQYTVMLILILVKLLLFRMELANSLDGSHSTALSVCNLTNIAGEQVQQAPVLMIATANHVVVATTNQVIDSALSEAISLAHGIEKLLILGLDLLIGTYACMSLAVIDGAANVATNATESVISYANQSIIAAEKIINESVDDLTEAFDTLESLVTVVTDYFSDADNEITHVSSTVNHTFASWYIPTGINSKLEALRSDVPSYDSVKISVESLIKKPFTEITTRLNTTLQTGALHIDYSAISSTISQSDDRVCSSEEIDAEFQNFRRILSHVLIAIIILLVLLLLGSLLSAWYREHSNWKWITICASDPLLRRAGGENNYNRFLFFLNQASSHLKWQFIIFLRKFFGIDDPLQEILVIWWLSYMGRRNCIILLRLALAGFLVVSAQYIILDVLSRTIESAMPKLVSVVHAVAIDFESEAVKWANETNNVLKKTETDVNGDIFSWINAQSISLNKTISTLMLDLNSTIASTFGSTPLESVVSGVVACTIGSKISEAEKALTWLSQLSVKLPLVDSSFLSSNKTLGKSLNSGSQMMSTVVESSLEKIVTFYQNTLKIQLLISSAFMSAWLLLAIASLLYCLFVYHTADRKDLLARNSCTFSGPASAMRSGGLLPPNPDTGFSLYQLNSSFVRADSSLLPSLHAGHSEEHLASLQIDPDNPPPFLLTDPMKSIFSASQPSPTTIRSEHSTHPLAWKAGQERSVALTSEDHRMSAVAPLVFDRNVKE